MRGVSLRIHFFLLPAFDFRVWVRYLFPEDFRGRGTISDATEGSIMQHHATLVSILHIVYSAMNLFGAAFVGALALVARRVLVILIREHMISPHDVPLELLDLFPLVLAATAVAIAVCSIPGLIAGFAYLRHREWARITLLVVSFFYLINIPLGTLLGGYSIWVLMQEETVRLSSRVGPSPAP